ncbi:MAG: glycoside hydrolase family 15 protein [Synechococcus sp. Tobar2m-G35]|nr:glycoside hydrolase family 15 protein [Synechococcus sp. Tobar2m-G35]
MTPTLTTSLAAPPPERLARLQALDAHVERVLLGRQHPLSGLMPASTAHTVHGNYGDAWVRDGVYTIQAVWGLRQAWLRLGGHPRRVYELEGSVRSLMRGLLRALMGQAAKVERFKLSGDPLDALHAKYDTATGQPVVADNAWGHLQLDATALFLLQLGQITRAGLPVVVGRGEVAFVQNLVYYVSRAYRLADYGIWERGDKGNNGAPERNASSIGLVKAALEVLGGLDLYGPHGDGSTRLWVPPDALVRLRRALQALLPRESASKEVDSACLTVIGYPAWAVEQQDLRRRTLEAIRQRLGGSYGYARFRRDGHQTVVEDSTRLHYEPEELALFEGIECQWPLFLAFELVTACLEERWDEARSFEERLRGLAVTVDGEALQPELYRVPADLVEAERRYPGSQRREPNENVPLLWTQSLWVLGQLLLDGLLQPADLDPAGRRLERPLGCRRVRVALVPGDDTVAAALEAAGLPLERGGGEVAVAPSARLAEAFSDLGAWPELGLSGPPPGGLATLAHGHLYICGGVATAFLSPALEEGIFYLADDPEQLADAVLGELRLLQRHWPDPAADPLLLLPVARAPFQRAAEAFQGLLRQLQQGGLGGVEVLLGTLADHAPHLRLEPLPLPALAPGRPPAPLPLRLDEARGHRSLSVSEEQALESRSVLDLAAALWSSTSLREQAELLEQLQGRLGSEAQLQAPERGLPIGLSELIEGVYRRSLEAGDWEPVRRCAGLLGLVHPHLEDALDDLLARQRQLVVGRNYTDQSRIREPLDSATIVERMRRFSGEDGREVILQQELLLALEQIARQQPSLLHGTLTFQLGQLLLLLTSELALERRLSPSEAFEALCALPPHGISRRLGVVLADLDHARASLDRCEQLHVSGQVLWKAPPPAAETPMGGCWLQHRLRQGALQRIPRDFHPGVWGLLRHCRGLLIGDKLERRNRLDSDVLAEKTPGEHNFAALVEHLLSKIEAPEYRQLSIEALLSLMAFFEANPQVSFGDHLALDVLIGHAVRLGWQQAHPSVAAELYGAHKAQAWDSFYRCSPTRCRELFIEALQRLAATAA